MIWRLKHKLFGWDYVAWRNSAANGVARVYVSGEGKPYYWRYKFTKVLDPLDPPGPLTRITWLTCPPSKYGNRRINAYSGN